MNFLVFLQAAEGTAKQGGNYTFLIMILLIFVVMWFLMIRPQQKKQKELVKFRESLKRGDKIVTVGGIYGTVQEVKENTLLIEIDNNVKIRVDKASVVRDFSEAQQQ
ncbi:MAG: preprotein translocase subunit YajC [Bacteroidales bacterium]|nr:preprotein translocase subunit YajC [Bacteroidales bacterium]